MEKKLKSYLSNKAEIAELRRKLKEIKDDDLILDFDAKRCSRLRSRYITTIMRLEAECEECEEYVSHMKDSESRRIIRMYFLEGMNQNKISRVMCMDQGTISKKIKKALNGN